MGTALVVELRKKVGGTFDGDDRLHFVRTHIKAVDGLMLGEKIKLSLLPSEILKSKKQVEIITSNKTTAELLSMALTFVGGNTEALIGAFFIINTATSVTITVSSNHEILNGDNETGTISAGQTVVLEDGDQISMNNYGTGWEVIETIAGYGASNPSLPNPTYPNGAKFFNTTDGFVHYNLGGNWASNAVDYVNSYGATLPGSPAENQTFFLTGVLTKYRYKQITGWSIIDNNMPYAVGAASAGASTGGKISPADISKLFNLVSNATHTGDVTGSTTLTIAARAVTAGKLFEVANARILGRVTSGNGDVEQLTKAQMLSFLNVADGANNYSHPTNGANVTRDGGGIQFLADIVVNNLGHVTSVTLDTIQDGTTGQKGVLQLANGDGEWKTAQSASKALTPALAKTMMDWFATLDIDTVVANLNARHPDGAFALLQTGTVSI